MLRPARPLVVALSWLWVFVAGPGESPRAQAAPKAGEAVETAPVEDAARDAAQDAAKGARQALRLDEARGTLLFAGGSVDEDVRAQFARLARGRDGELVIITSASHRANMVAESFFSGPWEGYFDAIRVFHPRDKSAADADDALAMLRKAKAIWFTEGLPERLDARFAGTQAARIVRDHWLRGGALGAAGGACIGLVDGRHCFRILGPKLRCATVFVEDWEAEDREKPNAQRTRVRERMLRRKQLLAPVERRDFASAVNKLPGSYGIRIAEGSSALVRGRSFRVLSGSVELFFGGWRPGFEEPSARFSRPGQFKLAERARGDLEEWRRAALSRTRTPQKIAPVGVRKDLAKGALMVVGGGRMSAAMWRRFLELAGGVDKPVLVVPSAGGGRPRGASDPSVRRLQSAGATNVKVWHAPDRARADDPAFCKALEGARGIWFSGGRQWRLVDRYEGTLALRRFEEVLKRGGVIAGSSAGCSIHAQCMVRGSPRGNRIMLAEGYEHGFGFLGGIALDQHFTQRRRLPDLERAVASYPRLTGIGIDEGTALLWRANTCEVIGDGTVTILEPHRPRRELASGKRYEFNSDK